MCMHKAILSDKERTMIERFLKTDEKSEGFRMLKVRIKRNYERIAQDFGLIRKVFEKIQ